MIPKDSVEAMRKLADPVIRKEAGVLENNIFLFASTQMSELNVSGWHALKDVCKDLNLINPRLINATNNRHRVSTIYATLDLPQQEKQLFYTHMGHSEEMNREVYQAPLALMGLTKTGKHLMDIGYCELKLLNISLFYTLNELLFIRSDLKNYFFTLQTITEFFHNDCLLFSLGDDSAKKDHESVCKKNESISQKSSKCFAVTEIVLLFKILLLT